MSNFIDNPLLTTTILLDLLGLIGAGIKCHKTDVRHKRWTLFMLLGIGFFWLFTTDLSFLLTGDSKLTPVLYLVVRSLFVFPIWFTVFSTKQW
jgi:hypothetical protein